MIRFYFHPTPNPAKIALFLEEAALPYEAIPVDTSKGEQHTSAFRAINPSITIWVIIIIVYAPLILHPFPNIPMHTGNLKIIRFAGSNLNRPLWSLL